MRYQKFYEMIKEKVDNEISLNEINDKDLLEFIELTINTENINQKMFLTLEAKLEISNRIYNSIRGFGLLDSIMEDEEITEIMINGYENIFIEKNGRISKLKEKFDNEEKLGDLIQRIVGKAGREVNQANPIVDARLPDGSRVNVVLPPIALNGALVTIRKFSKTPMTIKKLIEFESITQEVANFLELLVKAKYNIFISGGTGSGKTTFLNALSNFIPKDERVITIEDSAELQIIGIENLIRMETRNINSAGAGEVNMRDLIKTALRMRPERIVVGEVRGIEAFDMLQAMNTGHDGSLSTGHANSAKDMLSRLETMVLTVGENLPLSAVRHQIASAIDIIVHLSRMRDKSRKVVEISEIVGIEDGEILTRKLFEFVEVESDASNASDKVVGELQQTENTLLNTKKLDSSNIV